MILLDTHIWIWWVDGDSQLSEDYRRHLDADGPDALGASVMSCWEVAKLVEKKRLVLASPTLHWINLALAYPRITLLKLTPEIVVESTQLPNGFHRDPVDQILVTTSRIHHTPVMTADSRICKYPHVRIWKSNE